MADNRGRLEKLLGMLGSEHDGERANAAAMIARMAKAEGKSIADLVMSGRTQTVYVEKIVYRDPPYQTPPGGVGDQAYQRMRESFDRAEREAGERLRKEAQRRAQENATGLFRDLCNIAASSESISCLSAWEVEFLRDVVNSVRHDHELTFKQRERAAKIIAKVKRAEMRKNAEPLI